MVLPQVIEMVVGTDMKQHFTILSHFNTAHRLPSYAAQSAAVPAGSGAASAASTPTREGPELSPPRCDPCMPSLTAPSHSTLALFSHTAARIHLHAFAHTVSIPPPCPFLIYTHAQSPTHNSELASGATAAAGSLSASPTAAVSTAHPPPGSAPSPLDEAERLLTLQVALKAADVGHLGEELCVHERCARGRRAVGRRRVWGGKEEEVHGRGAGRRARHDACDTRAAMTES